MARAGLAVPASHPVVLPPFASVLADIGDTQSLQNSLSTFSGHLKRIQVTPPPPQHTQPPQLNLGLQHTVRSAVIY
jgi:hypothetical protein